METTNRIPREVRTQQPIAAFVTGLAFGVLPMAVIIALLLINKCQ